MTVRFDISAGELFDLVRPVVNVVCIFLSTWVLASARKRFPLYQALAWTAGTLFLPLVVLPIYLVTLLVLRRPVQQSVRWRYSLPLAYAVIVMSIFGLSYYLNTRTVDAYLARAIEYKLNEDYSKAIAEYRKALVLNNDAHVHRLLGTTLLESGHFTEAISELRLAEQEGEQDDLISFQLAQAFERIDLKGQASLEYEKFLLTPTCLKIDYRCDAARDKLGIK